MLITIVVQNLGRGGLLDGSGRAEDRWPLLAERIGQHHPDLVLIQEVEQWDRDGHLQLVRAERDLDLDGLLAPSLSGRGPGILYRRETLGRRTAWKTDDNERETHHGFGVITFDVGLPKPLAIAAVHLTPWSSDRALGEAQYVCSRAYRYGPYAIVGGDINFPPAEAWPGPDHTLRLPFNTGARTLLADPELGESPQPDRRIGWKFRQNGFRDAARVVFDRDQDKAVLAPTAAGDRIDQLWVSAPPAALRQLLADDPETASLVYSVIAHRARRKHEIPSVFTAGWLASNVAWGGGAPVDLPAGTDTDAFIQTATSEEQLKTL